jgi:hypothetical protein
MKKKPVKRKAVGGLMGALADSGIKAPVGIIPQMIYNRRKDSKANATAAATPTPQAAPSTMPSGPMQRPERAAKGMKRGGKVRGDGICQRGKTRGKVT